MKKFLLSFLMLIAVVPLWAEDFVADGIYYNITDETAFTVEVTWSEEYTGIITIPEIVAYNEKNYSVTSIGSRAFNGLTGLTEVTIPNSVTSIGEYAFSGCTGLTSITIPNSVTTIGRDAFYETPWYNSQPDGIMYISNVLYEYKGTMPAGTSIDINDGTVTITDAAFGSCSGLTSITIPNSVTTIGSQAFAGCTGLTSITIPNSVTSIGYHAFSGCTGLTEVTIPNSVTSIGYMAFYETPWYNSQPDGIMYISNVLYKYRGTMPAGTSIDINDGTVTISDGAFYNCSGLTSITIPNSVTTIDDDAFRGCSGLTSITIPNSVTSIGESAFRGCSGLTELTIPNSVTTIGYEVFSGCSGLTSITIPNSVTSIGVYAFSGCNGLTSITIPNSVTTIDDHAFSYCRGLTSITIPNSVTTIGSNAFYYCSGLTSITIPNSVTTIGSNAFVLCSGLTSVILGNSVTSIGSQAFKYNDNLTEIYSLNPTPPTAMMGSLPTFWEQSYSATLYVPAEAYNAYYTTAPWSNFTTIKPLTLVTDISVEVPTACIVGQSTQLNAVVSPNNATVINVSWSSSDPTVASVDATGLLKYLKEGKTTITATAADGSGISDSFEIEVKAIKVSSITLNHDRLRLDVDSTATLTATFAPENASYKTAEWSVSDNSIVALTDNGDGTATVKQLAKGSAWVIARTTDGTNLADTCEVTTIQLVEAITLNPTAATIPLYEQKTITATVEPATADNIDIVWSSSDTSIAVIKEDANGNGVVAMIAEGTATITATATDGSGVTATCAVSTDVLVNEISLDKTKAELMIGETLTLNSSVGPDNAVNKEVQWRSNNEKVATVSVDANGTAIVTAIAAGEAIVSVFTIDGTNLIADCHITVARGEDAPNVVTLTIKECEGGNLEIAVTDGETINIAVNAMFGWEINSVTFNGEDVTADFIAGELFTTPAIVEDSELVITYSSKLVDVEDITAQAKDVKVYGYDNTITIKGADVGSVVEVVDTKGVVIYSGIEKSITIDNDGVYIVTVEGRTFKLAL